MADTPTATIGQLPLANTPLGANDFFEVEQDGQSRRAPYSAFGGSTWLGPNLDNGWVNYGVTGYAVAAFAKAGERIRLRGAVKDGLLPAPGGSVVLTTLPAGYRPPFNKSFLCDSRTPAGDLIVASLEVKTDGRVVIYSGGNGYLSLDQIEYEAN